jgi:hypothetical protein
VKFDGVERDSKLARDGLVAEPRADRIDDVELARRQDALSWPIREFFEAAAWCRAVDSDR